MLVSSENYKNPAISEKDFLIFAKYAGSRLQGISSAESKKRGLEGVKWRK